MPDGDDAGALSVQVTEGEGALQWHTATGYDQQYYELACGRHVDLDRVLAADGQPLDAIDGHQCVGCLDRLDEDGGEELVLACPECDRTSSIRRTIGSGKTAAGTIEEDWSCTCGLRFDEPRRREKRPGGGRKGLSARLADPEVSDFEDLRTDGGTDTGDTERNGPIGGDCDKQDCTRAAYRHVGPLKVCHDHKEWAKEEFPTRRFECENGHSFGGRLARCCPECQTAYVYMVTEVGDRVPV